jgi:hypothetical protein
MKQFLFSFFLISFAYAAQSQVQLQNGSANFDFPIFAYTDAKSGLSHNIVLSYNSGNGIRVNQVASNVGLGWTLHAGGSIERIQCGEPDDQYDNTFSLPDADQIVANDNLTAFNGYYPNGFLYTGFSLSDIPKELAVQPRFATSVNKYKLSPRSSADREQDYFSLNLNGRLSLFAIGKNGLIESLDDSKLKIEYTTQDMRSQNIRTRINEFTVTDELGIKYKFSTHELSELTDIEPTYTDSYNFSLSIMSSSFIGKYVINKWQLTEIINPFTNESIIFYYMDEEIEYVSDKTPVYQKIASEPYEGLVITNTKIRIKTRRLTNIQYPDGTFVGFSTGTARYDCGGNTLNFIDISAYGMPSRKIRFKQGYFYRNQVLTTHQPSLSDHEKQYLRLCLREITVEGAYQRGQGPFNIGTHKFEYYTGQEIQHSKSMVPMRYTFAQDAWGYHNLSSLIDDDASAYDREDIRDFLMGYQTNNTRAVYPLAARTGLLKSITYPTGGKLTYEYGQNTYNNSGTPINVGGVHVSKTTLHDNVSTANDQVTEYSYVNADNTSSAWGYEVPAYETVKGVTVRKDNSGYNTGGLMMYDHTSRMYVKGISAVWSAVASAAIAYALSMSAFNPAMIIVNVIVAYIVSKMVLLMYNWLDPEDFFYTTTYSLLPHFSGNPVGIQFSRAEVKNISVADPIGRTVFEYTRPEVSWEILSHDFPFSKKQRFEGWKYGLLKKVTAYDKDNNPVKENETTYTFPSTILQNDNFRSVKIDANELLSSRYDYFAANRDWVSDSWISKEFYYLRKGRVSISQNREKLYGQNGKYFENFTTYTYNQNAATDNYLPREVSSTNSRNDLVGKTTYYSRDYTATGPLASMVANHIYNVPVAELSWVVHAGTSARKYLGARVTEFITLSNGEIKPYKIYVAENPAPVPASQVGAFDPNAPLLNYPDLKLVSTNTYDNTGNLVKVTGEGDQRTSFIYDMNMRMVTAQVVNADPDEIAYTSFESMHTGSWTFAFPPQTTHPSTTPTYNTENSPTGHMYCHISSSLNGGLPLFTKAGLNSSREYIVSYWSKMPGITVNGQTVSPAYNNPVTGWSLYIHKVTGVTQVNVGGEGSIDELRLYPADARMQTIGYDIAFGKQSECDANNRIIYYSYDHAGRLIYMQDHEKNVIKTYEYNVINK